MHAKILRGWVRGGAGSGKRREGRLQKAVLRRDGRGEAWVRVRARARAGRVRGVPKTNGASLQTSF